MNWIPRAFTHCESSKENRRFRTSELRTGEWEEERMENNNNKKSQKKRSDSIRRISFSEMFSCMLYMSLELMKGCSFLLIFNARSRACEYIHNIIIITIIQTIMLSQTTRRTVYFCRGFETKSGWRRKKQTTKKT